MLLCKLKEKIVKQKEYITTGMPLPPVKNKTNTLLKAKS